MKLKIALAAVLVVLAVLLVASELQHARTRAELEQHHRAKLIFCSNVKQAVKSLSSRVEKLKDIPEAHATHTLAVAVRFCVPPSFSDRVNVLLDQFQADIWGAIEEREGNEIDPRLAVLGLQLDGDLESRYATARGRLDELLEALQEWP